jgi:hypothetical protein
MHLVQPNRNDAEGKYYLVVHTKTIFMKLIFCFFLFLMVASCRQPGKIPDNFDYGKTENGIYSNQYFDFKLLVPAAWHIQSKEKTSEMIKEGQKTISEHNEKIGEIAKASEITTANLIAVFKNPIDSVTGEINNSFMIIAENLGRGSGISTGKDYLEHAKQLMERSGMSYAFPEEIHSEKLGNKQFDVMIATLTMNGQTIQEVYYTIIKNNFALSIITACGNAEQKDEVHKIIDQIAFE